AFLLGKFMRRSVDAIKCAPTLEPQGRISLSRLWTRMVQADMAQRGSLEGGQAVRFGDARQVFLSAEPSANVVGHTAGILLEVDEADVVEREESARGLRAVAAGVG